MYDKEMVIWYRKGRGDAPERLEMYRQGNCQDPSAKTGYNRVTHITIQVTRFKRKVMHGEGMNELDLGSLPGIEKGPASSQPPTPIVKRLMLFVLSRPDNHNHKTLESLDHFPSFFEMRIV
jgi:hypothetical protein